MMDLAAPQTSPRDRRFALSNPPLRSVIHPAQEIWLYAIWMHNHVDSQVNGDFYPIESRYCIQHSIGLSSPRKDARGDGLARSYSGTRMDMAHRIALRALLAGVSILAFSGQVAAQDADPADAAAQTQGPDAEAAPGEIIVTAQRRDQRLQDVPIAVRSEEHTSELQSL